jgi:hypothetical protein
MGSSAQPRPRRPQSLLTLHKVSSPHVHYCSPCTVRVLTHRAPLHTRRRNNQSTAARFAQYSDRPEPGADTDMDTPPSSKYDLSSVYDNVSGYKRPMSSAFGKSRSARLPFATVNGDMHAHTEGRFARYYTLNLNTIKRNHGMALFSAQCRGVNPDYGASPGPAAYIPSMETVKPHLRGGSWMKSVRMPTKRLVYSDVIQDGSPSLYRASPSPSRTSSRESRRVTTPECSRGDGTASTPALEPDPAAE